MPKSFKKEFSKYNADVEKSKTQYSALLGKTATIIEHPTRNGYCYARMADNLNELITVFNDKVSQVYNLPILVERRGNVWYVIGRDSFRYNNWGDNTSFIPKHHLQHEFNRDLGTGADTVFVYPDQFMPLLVYPSGTLGSGNLLVAPYMLQRSSDFIYVGNTGTRNVLVYRPTNNQAIMGLVVLDKTTGNPDILIASGTPFAGSITGTWEVAPYIPYPSSNQEPLYAFRLVSGTTALDWSNLYNVRQFIGGSNGTGSSGGVPTFITGSIPFSGSDGILTEDNPHLFWNNSDDQLWVGNQVPTVLRNNTLPIVAVGQSQNAGSGMGVLTFGTGTSGSPAPAFNGYRQRGTLAVPTPVQNGDALNSSIGNGYDGASFQPAARIRVYADENWITGTALGSRFDFDAAPTGSATRSTVMSILGGGIDVKKTFMLSGEISASIVASVNDYNPTGFDEAGYLDIGATGGLWNITGLKAGKNGRVIVFRNRSATQFILKENSSSSSVGNRFNLPHARDLVLYEGNSVILRYHNTVWEVISHGVLPPSQTVPPGNLVSFANSTGEILYNIGTPQAVVAGAIITGTHKIIPNNTDLMPYTDSTGTLLFNSTWLEFKNFFDGRYQGTGTAAVPTIEHNNTTGIQGGGTGSYFHLTGNQINGLVSGTFTALHHHDGLYQPTGTTIPNDGWNAVSGTVSYFSADSPSFVINVPGNITGTYDPGVKWKLGHLGTTKYFIQTGLPTYVSGAYTSINLYGGTDYTLTTGSISNPFTSRVQSPFGFPLSPAKWSVLATSSTNDSQANPSGTVWYNPNSFSIVAPIGLWYLSYKVSADVTVSVAGSPSVFSTLSTANNSESNSEYSLGSANSLITFVRSAFTLPPSLLIALTKTTWYFNGKSNAGSTVTSIAFRGDLSQTRINLLCAYL